jgi:hypothetical protein
VDSDGTALGEISGAGDVKLVLIGGARCKGGQGLLRDAIAAEPLLDPSKLDLSGLNLRLVMFPPGVGGCFGKGQIPLR